MYAGEKEFDDEDEDDDDDDDIELVDPGQDDGDEYEDDDFDDTPIDIVGGEFTMKMSEEEKNDERTKKVGTRCSYFIFQVYGDHLVLLNGNNPCMSSDEFLVVMVTSQLCYRVDASNLSIVSM